MNAEDPAIPLLGTWSVRTIAGEPTPDDVESVITFAVTDDGEHRVHGRGGVNRIGGGFELHEEEISFGPFFTTLMAGPEPAMRHEHAFTRALTGRHPFQLHGDVLVVGAGEHEVVFDRVVESIGDAVEITGAVWYRQRIALPPGAVVTVRLSDTSRADAPATVLAEQVIEPEHQVPIPFTLTVARSALEDRGRYSLSARITVGGELRWISDSHIPVSLSEPTTDIDVLVHPADAARR